MKEQLNTRQTGSRGPQFTSRPSKWNKQFFFLAALTFLVLFSTLNQGDLSGYDDALYAHEAKEMILTGRWLEVRFNGLLNFQYPPLFLWLEAASMRIFGITDFAAKFPAALLGALTIILTYFIAYELTTDVWLSLIAMFVLLSTQYFIKYAMHAMTDVPCTFFVTAAALAYVKSRRNSNYLLICGLALGLATLTRSVVGLLPGGVFVTHWIASGRSARVTSRQAVLGSLMALLPTAGWYALQYSLFGNASLATHTSFIAEKIGLGSFSVSERVIGLLEYPKLLLRLYWPWLPILLVGILKQLRRCFIRDEFALLTMLWIAWVLIPFSLADAKVLRYLMPAFPAFALAVAAPLNGWISTEKKQKAFRWLYGLAPILLLGLVLFSRPLLRAADMKLLAPLAEAHSSAEETILLYTNGTLQYGYNNQFLWYANRHSDLLTDLDELRVRIQSLPHAIVLMDRPSFEKFQSMIVEYRIDVLETSERFVCLEATASGRFNESEGAHVRFNSKQAAGKSNFLFPSAFPESFDDEEIHIESLSSRNDESDLARRGGHGIGIAVEVPCRSRAAAYGNRRIKRVNWGKSLLDEKFSRQQVQEAVCSGPSDLV